MNLKRLTPVGSFEIEESLKEAKDEMKEYIDEIMKK